MSEWKEGLVLAYSHSGIPNLYIVPFLFVIVLRELFSSYAGMKAARQEDASNSQRKNIFRDCLARNVCIHSISSSISSCFVL